MFCFWSQIPTFLIYWIYKLCHLSNNALLFLLSLLANLNLITYTCPRSWGLLALISFHMLKCVLRNHRASYPLKFWICHFAIKSWLVSIILPWPWYLDFLIQWMISCSATNRSWSQMIFIQRTISSRTWHWRYSKHWRRTCLSLLNCKNIYLSTYAKTWAIFILSFKLSFDIVFIGRWISSDILKVCFLAES